MLAALGGRRSRPEAVDQRRAGRATSSTTRVRALGLRRRRDVADRGSLARMIPARFAPVLDELPPLTERFARRRPPAVPRRWHGARPAARQRTARLRLRPAPPTPDPPEIKALPRTGGPTRSGPRASGSARSAPRRRATASTRSRRTAPRRTPTTRASRTSTFADDIEADLSRRDFTVNAMALELTGAPEACPSWSIRSAAPPTSSTRTLRTPLGPEVSFGDDPLRMLRAARFIARYDLTPVPELVAAVVAMRDRLRDRVGRAHPRRARQADRRARTRRRVCGSSSRPACPTSSCPSCRRCGSSRTRSIATRTC